MKTNLFDFKIPDELIAQYPSQKRSDSRLLIYFRKEDKIIDSYTKNISEYLIKDHFLVFNNSKVYPARLKIQKKSNNVKGELLILKIIDPHNIRIITDKSKKYPVNTEMLLPDGSIAVIKENLTNQVKIASCESPIFDYDYFDKFGLIPIPPYIRKSAAETCDRERYQTIYSTNYGSSAAPTAGLHFDDNIFMSLKECGIEHAFVSLHVGLGTFNPIHSDNIEDHIIHEEEYFIESGEMNKINNAIKSGKKIISVGTTSCRTIETSYADGFLKNQYGNTSLYIYPPYHFKVISGLITNFHTPKSSLLVLVSSLTGYENLKKIYEHAIKKEYRFFSYGDAMLIL